MRAPDVTVSDDARGVRTLALARPERHNAFDDVLVAELTARLEQAASDEAVRVVVLTGEGSSFSAGADIAWMKRAADDDEAANLEDARRLARLMTTLDRLAKPTIARVNGAAIGGGVGLVAACDIAVAADAAVFALSEVRLGLIPAVIAPFLVRAIGARQARRLVLTAERIDATAARAIGLVHEVVPDDRLDERVEGLVGHLLAGGPDALARAKRLVDVVAYRQPDDESAEATAQLLARVRGGDEAKEGLAAFLAERRPGWR
ncbi:MAG: enoyl-CoA hydratase-related protein [Alphaproteobacteria bacterium]